MLRRIGKTLFPIALLAVLVAVGASAATSFAVKGAGSGTHPEDGLFPGASHSIELAAKGSGTAAAGDFHFTHVEPDGTLFAEFFGEVECVALTGNRAAVTGVVTGGLFPFGDPSGERIALTVADGSPDRVWFDFSFLQAQDDVIEPCERTSSFLVEIDEGDFRVGR